MENTNIHSVSYRKKEEDSEYSPSPFLGSSTLSPAVSQQPQQPHLSTTTTIPSYYRSGTPVMTNSNTVVVPSQQQQQQVPNRIQQQPLSSVAVVSNVPFTSYYGGYYGGTTTNTALTTTTTTDAHILSQSSQQLPSSSSSTISPTTIHQRRSSTTTVAPPLLDHHRSYYNNVIPSSSSSVVSSSLPRIPKSYHYNTMIAIFYIPCWCCIYFPLLLKVQQQQKNMTTMLPIHVFIFSSLLIYGIDIANIHRTYTLYVVWITSIIELIINIWLQLPTSIINQQHDDSSTTYDDDNEDIIFITVVVLNILFFTCTALWYTIQCQWLIPNTATTHPNIHSSSSNNGIDSSIINNRDSSTFRRLESTLHGIIPPLFAILLTIAAYNWMDHSLRLVDDYTSTLLVTPYVFVICMTTSMLMIGTLPSTLSDPKKANAATTDHENKKYHNDESMDLDYYYCFSNTIATTHIRLLIYLPGIIHMFLHWNRIMSQHVTFHDIYDILLILCIPYIILIVVVKSLHTTNILRSPYGLVLSNHHHHHPPTQQQQLLLPQIRDQIILVTMTLIVSWSLQQRYLISICHSLSYHYFGTQIPTWQCTMYWSFTTLLLYGIVYIWGRTNPVNTDQLLFGEFHEDVVQLLLSAIGLCVGKAFGLSWNMVPLPILGILGLIFWINTRMLRYLSIVLFVIHSIGVVMFTFRYVGIDQNLSLPLPKVDVSLVRFGMLLTTLSVVIGLIAGLAVRSSGGYMAGLIKRLDVVGILSIFYTFLLMIMEITLLKKPVPTKELIGFDYTEGNTYGTLYDVPKAILTSIVLIGIVLFMKRTRMLHEWSAAVVLSLSMGKAIAIYTYATQLDLGIGNHHMHDTRGTSIVYRALIATILCAIMFIPRVFLEPIRLKNSIRSRRASREALIPPHAIRLISLYTFVFVPISLIATLPYVVFPLINAVRAQFTQTSYYVSSPPISELVGSAIALWGLSLISMLNHFLPDGGAEAWKKLASLAFLMGLGFYFVAPTIGLGVESAMYNPYAHMSSVGRQIIIQAKIRTSGWGIIAAAMATLLAVSGPLELKERALQSGRKDKYLLLRTMIFGLLFGGGMSWFIVLQCMSESEWILVILTVLAAMVVAFLGTVATVLGYYLELQNFDDIEQIAKTWMYGFLVFLPITGIPHLLYSDAPLWFGPGGWLTPYLGVASLSSFTFTLSLRNRQTKDSQTRGIGNSACVVSWLLSNGILYGRNGVAGSDPSFDAFDILGVPGYVFGTILLSTMLLALDGESSRGRGGTRASVTTSVRHRKTFWRLTLNQLDRNNQWFPLLAGCFTIFMFATIYTIFFRGSGFGFSVTRPQHDAIENTIQGDGEKNEALSILVRKAIDLSVDTSTKLDNVSLWTATNMLWPTLHFIGVLSVCPSFHLLHTQYWRNKSVSLFPISAAIPFNVIPIVLCRSIPSLTATAIMTLACAIMQLMGRRQSEYASRMRI